MIKKMTRKTWYMYDYNLGVQQNQAWFIWYDDMPFDITTKASYFIF